jgi:hypothetical protein
MTFNRMILKNKLKKKTDIIQKNVYFLPEFYLSVKSIAFFGLVNIQAAAAGRVIKSGSI